MPSFIYFEMKSELLGLYHCDNYQIYNRLVW